MTKLAQEITDYFFAKINGPKLSVKVFQSELDSKYPNHKVLLRGDMYDVYDPDGFIVVSIPVW